MSIKQYIAKIKGSGDKCVDTQTRSQNSDIFLILLIIIVAFASFGLGRLSTIEHSQNNSAIVFEAQAVNTSYFDEVPKNEEGEIDKVTSGEFVASVNGTKYHFPWCSGAVRIKEENKIWFNTIEEARAAGYTPAANCKGLE